MTTRVLCAAGLAVLFLLAPAPSAQVPLVLWTDANFPTGLDFGATRGIAMGDYDADGWVDVYANDAGLLWRNVNGTTWEIGVDLSALITAPEHYSASFGDYDNDGFPDIATEPRGTTSADQVDLLHNQGDGTFVDVAEDPLIVDTVVWGLSETICWGDVDGDHDLDCFIPTYSGQGALPGNYFLENKGPTGPGGAYRFEEGSATIGTVIPVGAARPEGAQLVDTDLDGDMDLYCNGYLYLNESTTGTPSFSVMPPTASGIGRETVKDEGAAFFDYDMDGDYDLLIAYANLVDCIRIWENRGDGNFGDRLGRVEDECLGIGLGLSYADWDNDGDIDLTTKNRFRINTATDGGVPQFLLVTPTIDPDHITKATPAWGDWDRDGDLDAAISNFTENGRLYENTTYSGGERLEDLRYVRVRPLADSVDVPAGLETEYGASVELVVHGDAPGVRRKNFTSSSAGYVNQSEYTLHFGLPPDPAPGDAGEDVHFDVVVDFPTLPPELRRVDKHVNPALGDINLADLTDREIEVFRSGLVRIGGQSFPPTGQSPLLQMAGGGLMGANAASLLPAPTAAAADTYIGLDFDTVGAAETQRLAEVVLDGRFDTVGACGPSPINLALWDVTVPGGPTLVPGSARLVQPGGENRRVAFLADMPLAPDRRFRLVARVDQTRATPFAGPVAHGGLTVNGGLLFTDLSPCTGAGVDAATVDPTQLYLTVRFGPTSTPWDDLGFALAGTGGTPTLTGTGNMVADELVGIDLEGALGTAPAVLFMGVTRWDFAPFYGGTLVPASFAPGGAMVVVVTGAAGGLSLAAPWPAGIPPGFEVYLHYWIEDAGGPFGFAASNALRGTTP